MVSYEIPKPPLNFFGRVREGVKLANAFIKGDKSTIANITATTVFSPLQPLSPFFPQTKGRTWDYQPGFNVQTRPEGFGRVSYADLRHIARQCEIVRLVLRTVKDQICGFEWQIVPKADSTASPDDPRIKELTKFFQRPDQVNTWDQWVRMLLDDHLVIDALSIYRVRDKVGRPYAFEVFDGARIKPLVDEDGRRPMSPDPAFQQIMHGAPWVDLTTDELLYMPRNMTPDYPIRGISAVEDAVMTAQTIIERQKSQLMYFTQGTMPDSYAKMPEGMTMEAIKAFEDRFNDLLRGNLSGRRGTPFLPSGAEIVPLKEADLKNDADEWFARIVCFSLGVPPTAFIKQMNRSSSETDKDRAQSDGQAPKMQFVKLVVDALIADFGPDYAEDLEFSWREGANMDPKEQADVTTEYVKSGVKTINEGRADIGLDPIEGGDKPMAFTPTGYVPLDAFEQQQQMQQQNMQAQAEARAAQAAALASGNAQAQQDGNQSNQGQNSKPANNEPRSAPAEKLGKAVRHKPIPFHRPIVEHAQQELVIKIHHILQKTAVSVAQQLKNKRLKLKKDDNDDNNNDAAEDVADAAVIAGGLDLSSLEALTDATPAYLERVSADSGKQVLSMLGVLNRDDLVNQIDANSLAFARARSAEMIGKKWVDGELVDNPDAEWVISDATRSDIQDIIESVYSGDLSPSDLTGAIKQAGAFSQDRAELISRTELMNANAQGTLTGMRSARDAGVKVTKAWQADDEACPVCIANEDDGAIDIDDDFSSGDDAPPAHPACECVVIPVTESSDDESDGDEEE